MYMSIAKDPINTAALKTAAVLPALGIGDALLMMIASHQLHQAGYRVTTFHDQLPEMSDWFPHQLLKKTLLPDKYIQYLSAFDLVIAENDNSVRIQQLIAAFQSQQIKLLSIFYPTYSCTKHGSVTPYDQIFNPNQPMADNIATATTHLISGISPSKSNGIAPPFPLNYRCHTKRILIHPTSREPTKNWKASQFLKLAARLKHQGFDPHFCISPSDREHWATAVADISCDLPHLPTLTHLSAYIYESAFLIGNDSLLGHLASNLNIPTLIIANDEKRMRLWRPGWRPGSVIVPPQWIPNPRLFRWKEAHWQYFLPVRSVLKKFLNKFNCKKTL